MTIQDAAGFFETRINIGQFFGRESEEVYITMIEPDETEQFEMSKSDAERIELMKKLWKKCLHPEKHNFETEILSEGSEPMIKPATKEQVIGIIAKKGICLSYIIGEWYKQIPLAKTNVSK